MLDNWHANWGEEIVMEMSVFQIVPGKGEMLKTHEMVHEIALCWPEKVRGINLVNEITLLGSVSSCWCKWRWIGQ